MVAPRSAQDKNDPLTPAEVEKLREVADQPIERVKLFMTFIEQRTDAIAEMVGDTRIQNKPPKIRQLLQEYTYLVDELQDNLDNYDETHSDIRKALKELVPASKKWLDTVNKPPPDPVYDFPRKTAADAAESLVDQATNCRPTRTNISPSRKRKRRNRTRPATCLRRRNNLRSSVRNPLDSNPSHAVTKKSVQEQEFLHTCNKIYP